jgi:hypothetical protein
MIWTEGGDDTGEFVSEHVPGGYQSGGQHMQVRAADAAAGDVDEHLSNRRCGAHDVDDAHIPVGAANGRSHWSVPAGA